MRNDINIVVRASAAISALILLASCASTGDAPPPPPPPPPVEYSETADAPDDSGESTVQVQPAAPLKYVVQKGDTLWDIAQKFLRDAWQWPEVWYVNEQVANPHLIYPGDVLYLTWVDGQPRVSREGEVVETRGGQDRLQPRVREVSLDAAVSAIPRELIAGFLRGPRIIEDEDMLDDAPYVLDFDDPRLMNAAESTAYVLDIEDTSMQRYQVVRKGKRYVDPDDGDIIGYEAIPVGEAEVRKIGDPSTVLLTRSDIETRVGDRLLPIDPNDLDTHFSPHAPANKVDGTIIDVFQGDTQIGQYQIVAINRGREQGLENGHVLHILQAGREAKDPNSFFGSKVQLPAVNAGTIMIFKTANRVSMGLVMTALRQIHVGDKVEKPASSR